jgi:hypothetical protein
MKGLVSAIDGMPWIIKIIFALPGIDGIVYGLLYRLPKGLIKKDLVQIVIGLLWFFFGFAILWIIDLITVILNKKVTVLVG